MLPGRTLARSYSQVQEDGQKMRDDRKAERQARRSNPRAEVLDGRGKGSRELGLAYCAVNAVFGDQIAPTKYPGMVSDSHLGTESGVIERVYAAIVHFGTEFRFHTSLMHWKHELSYPVVWRGLHKKSVVRGLVRTIRERAAATTSDVNPTMQEQLVIAGGRFVELAKALLLLPPLPGVHKGTLGSLLAAVLPEPTPSVVQRHQHVRMDTQGPDQFLIALLFYMLGRLRYHCNCDADADGEPFPDQVVLNITFGLSEVWKYMRSDSIGKAEETELILSEINATVSPWAVAATHSERDAELGPGTIPARTIGAIRMIVSRALDLNPVLLGSAEYATLRSNILRVQEAVDIQAGAWGRLGTNRLKNPSLPYPTLNTERLAPLLYRGMSTRRTIAPVSEVMPAFAAVAERDLQKAISRSTSPPKTMPWELLPSGAPGLLTARPKTSSSSFKGHRPSTSSNSKRGNLTREEDVPMLTARTSSAAASGLGTPRTLSREHSSSVGAPGALSRENSAAGSGHGKGSAAALAA